MKRAGSDAEDLAADYLLGIGYTLVSRRFTVKGGEIDIVAMDGDELVFVEVRARRDAENSLNPAKAESWRHAAKAFLTKMELTDRPYRFDLIAIEGGEIRHHRGLSE